MCCLLQIAGLDKTPIPALLSPSLIVYCPLQMLEDLTEESESGLLLVKNKVSYTLMMDNPDISYNDKEFKCEANMDGFPAESQSAVIQVYCEYSYRAMAINFVWLSRL